MTQHLAKYLATAEAAGLLHHLNGLPYVAGRYVDPIGGDTQGLVEYCDAGILGDPASVDALWFRLTEQFPDLALLRVRVRSPIDLPPPWERAVTYVRHVGPTIPVAAPGVRVTAAGTEHAALIEEWLTRAYLSGYRLQGRPAEEGAARARAKQILTAPERISYVALVDGVPVGHVTMLGGAVDEITGEEYIDLVDMLVEPGPQASVARHALVRSAVEHAERQSRPLLGTVVHPQANGKRGQEIVERLCGEGWRVDHVDWRRRSDSHGQ